MKVDLAKEKKLFQMVLDPELKKDPVEAAMVMFRWGEEGTILEKTPNPRKWQIDFLKQQRGYYRECYSRLANGDPLPPNFLQQSVVGGRGAGKSAILGMCAIMFLAMYPGSSTWVYANKEEQLMTKTFPEISKWLTCSIIPHWFDAAATSIRPANWLKDVVKRELGVDDKYWYIAAQLWNDKEPEGAAGAHNVNGEFAIFDEASGIPDPIWTVVNGVFTEDIPQRQWLVMSNGTRSTGAFFDTHHKASKYWNTTAIDIRDVEGVSESVWKPMIDTYGEEHDISRVHVLGKFALGDFSSFIPRESVQESMDRPTPTIDRGAPIITAVDVAYTNDSSTIITRQGYDLRSHKIETLSKGSNPELDTVTLYQAVVDSANKTKPDAIVIDRNGVGVGLYDMLKNSRLKGITYGVNFGESAPKKYKSAYANMKSYLWAKAKEWIEDGGALPKHQGLIDDILTTSHTVKGVTGRIMIETKESRLARGYKSSDHADAFVMTFAVQPPRRDLVKVNRPRQVRADDVIGRYW